MPKAPCPYNTRLQKGGALLDDMRLLVRRWSEEPVGPQGDAIVAENLLGKETRSRAFDTYRRVFRPRFVEGDPPNAWKLVQLLEERELSVEAVRPVYWLLQSPKKKYGIWVFHERLTADSLYRIQREYVDPKIKLLDGQLAELRKKRDATDGRERRRTEKEMAAVEDGLADIREFAARMDHIIQRGYTPHIDDGVLLNMAPLWELVPSWQAEPKKAWKALEKGDYDWAHHAMDYWPDRVKEKCKENKSFAIAHGLA
ncbi:MAG: BrxA family protein [Planctomycetota bacterium]